MSTTKEQLISILEDTAKLLKHAEINLKKAPKQRLSSRGYIEARIKCVDDYWITFKKTHDDLIKCTKMEERGALQYFVNEEYYFFEELYINLSADLKDILTSLPLRSSQRIASTSATSNTCSSGDFGVVKLPKIEIKKFYSNYEEFPAFQDLFESLVHNNSSLSNVEKLHYLKCSVGGEAELLLRNIQVTESNYLQAWDTLKNRFGNKRIIVNSILKRLYSQKKISSSSANQIKSLLDTTSECINNLHNLNIPTDSWDPLIIFLVVQKLDPESHQAWEEYAYKDSTEELPKWMDLKKFLENKFRILEIVTPSSIAKERVVRERSFHVTTKEKTCIMCKENHSLCHCKEFTKMSPAERSEYVKSNRLCFNCLVPGHSVMKCRIPMSCRVCHKRHHSLLHQQNFPSTQGNSSSIQPSVPNVEDRDIQVNTMMTSHSCNTRQHTALLATAMVKVSSEQGHTITLRALIDSGSQASFISEKAAQLIKLTRQPVRGNIVGIGSTKTSVKHMGQLKIYSRSDSKFSLQVQVYIMSNQLTSQIPAKCVPANNWTHLEGLKLADPTYYKPGAIDLLLGVKEYAQIIQHDIIKGPPGTPCAQKTNLGWILFGEIDNDSRNESILVMHHQVDVEEMLKTIWEIDTDSKRKHTREEQLCEDIYNKTYKRNDEGRYIVQLPFKTKQIKSTEGNTREIAMNRLLQQEKMFKRNPDRYEEYKKVINEYKTMKHVEEVPIEEIEEKKSFYAPHFAVIREGKESTNVRVVYDFSAKGSNGLSLNDELLSGPTLQEDLRSLIIRWRMHAICFVSDIEKMYRMILMDKSDIDYQRILWRDHFSDPIQELRLLTVTFGTAAAPYLAVKTLLQLAIDEGDKFPLAANIVREDFYVDDVLSGSDDVNTAVETSKQLQDLLSCGGFKLKKKWASNSADFMRTINPNERSATVNLDLNVDGTTKALGVTWNMGSDQFQYHINLPILSENITKRGILSDIQKLYDPLGWIAPAMVTAKMLIQKLWQEKVGWDDSLTGTLKEEWINIRSDFENVNDIRVERWFHTLSCDKDGIQIHGFSDASMKAYAAAVYCRVKKPDGSIQTKLIAARTKVAPLKTVSLPRLELCGAVLLSQLLKHVSQAMRIPQTQVIAWTDSSIVLSWLFGEVSRWKLFVANRVVEILENVNSSQWYHVESKENPADIASRGMSLKDLRDCQLWWKGPEWLINETIEYKRPNYIPTELEKKVIQVNLKVNNENEKTLLKQIVEFDDLNELKRCIALTRRFLKYKEYGEKIDTALTTQELEKSLLTYIKLVQEEKFFDEIRAIREKSMVKAKSPLKTFNPYLDDLGILRVGGRLRHANLDDDQKHPIILGNKNRLTELIIADAHINTIHGGVQLMLCYLRSKYWIIRAKGVVKKHIHNCLICARQSAAARKQLMGDLPKQRVTPSRPFSHSGVDFAGPLQVLISTGRGTRTKKSYIAIFVCMATKAIHLELVGDMTSEAFIGAFRRFVARRGKCSHLWSDQGRNFVGANKELVAAWKEARLEFSGYIADSLATDGTQWHFIPAYSPHHGGLWESGVKSIKHHLKRILNTHLTFEETTTILCQIEACLNTRPLSPIDDTSTDNLEPLTPGHFLIGEAPIVVPSPNLQNVKTCNLSRWQHTQKLVSDFWHKWQEEYLSRLQQRPKWLKTEKEFDIGHIVLIKNELLPPGKWALGRIISKHPGADGMCRVYSVKSGDTVTKRPVTKLCYLPIDITSDD